MSGWIGVDFDGTLAQYDGWQGALVFGEPIPAMVERVRAWLDAGYEVRIVTARVSKQEGVDTAAVFFELNEWIKQHVGVSLAIVDNKDFAMIELWDDRAIQVVQNTGEPVPGQLSRTEGPPTVDRYCVRCRTMDRQLGSTYCDYCAGLSPEDQAKAVTEDEIGGLCW